MRGNLLRALGRNAEALESYDRALAVAPNEVSALIGRADVLVALKRPDDALASLDQALSIDPSDAGALSNRGFLLQSLNRHDEALASLDRALQIDPNHAGALFNRGSVLSEFGRYGEALTSYDRAVAVSPVGCESALQSIEDAVCAQPLRRGARRHRAGARARSRACRVALYPRHGARPAQPLRRSDCRVRARPGTGAGAPACLGAAGDELSRDLRVGQGRRRRGPSDRGACGRNRRRRTTHPAAIVGQPGRDASRHPPLCGARNPARPAAGACSIRRRAATRSGWPTCRAISACIRSPI